MKVTRQTRNIPLELENANFLSEERAVYRSHSSHNQSLCTATQEENRSSSLENFHREKRHLEMQLRISKCDGYI